MNCANHSDVAATAYCRTCGKPLCNACARNVGGVVYCESCLAERIAQGTPGASYSQTVMSEGMGMPPNSPQAKPVLAALLALIPGVGAMYNGQFMKGVIHALAYVVLIGLTTRIPIFGIMIAFFVFYMVFDAYKTAEALRNGWPVPDPFGLERIFGPGVNQASWQSPMPSPPASGPAPGAPAWSAAQQQVSAAQQQAYATQQQATAAREATSCASDIHGIPIAAVILIGLGILFLLDNLGWFSFSADRFWPLILIIIGAWMFYKRWTRRVS